MNTALLELASRLSHPDGREGAAAALASTFGAECLLIFVRDPEVKQMLPAPGFPQTLPEGKTWRSFVEMCVPDRTHEGPLAVSIGKPAQPSIGFGCGADVAFVLVGATEPPADVAWFRALMPLIATALRGERVAAVAQTHFRLASESAIRAATLAQALDRTRAKLEDALLEARTARAELERVNRQLEGRAVELEATNALLRAQTESLEQQAVEMEAQAEELIATNAALDQARVASERASTAKSEFLATMSHELRTPLNAISGHVQLLELELHGPITPEQRQALERIDRSQRHLLGLINDILNLSRIEAGKVEYQLTDVRVRDALADLAPMIEPQLAAKGLEYDVRMADCPLAVRADTEKLQQILLNLLSNAVKFTGRGGRVWVECEKQSNDRIAICVSDNGLGIPPEKRDSIFEPFTQVDASHSRVGHGVGLGLSISRDLARGMGGDLTVRSEVGRGSAFTLQLGAAKEPRPNTSTPAQLAAQGAH